MSWFVHDLWPPGGLLSPSPTAHRLCVGGSIRGFVDTDPRLIFSTSTVLVDDDEGRGRGRTGRGASRGKGHDRSTTVDRFVSPHRRGVEMFRRLT